MTGPMHASTFTCTFSAVIDAFAASRSFLPSGIVVMVPGAMVVWMLGFTDAFTPTFADGTPEILTPTDGPSEKPSPTVSAHRSCADQPWKTRLERVQRVTACPIVIRVGCAGNIRIRRDASHPDGAVAQSVRAVDS